MTTNDDSASVILGFIGCTTAYTVIETAWTFHMILISQFLVYFQVVIRIVFVVRFPTIGTQILSQIQNQGDETQYRKYLDIMKAISTIIDKL